MVHRHWDDEPEPLIPLFTLVICLVFLITVSLV